MASGEQSDILRTGDRVRVYCGGLVTFEGTVLATRPDGMVLCVLDNTDRAEAIDPAKVKVEVLRSASDSASPRFWLSE